MSHFERFVTDGNAKAGVILDEGFMVETRAKTVEQERERERERKEVCAALQKAASFRCLVEEWKDGEELKLHPKEKCVFVE